MCQTLRRREQWPSSIAYTESQISLALSSHLRDQRFDFCPERMKPIHEAAQKAGRDSQYVELKKRTHMMAMKSSAEVRDALLSEKLQKGLLETERHWKQIRKT